MRWFIGVVVLGLTVTVFATTALCQSWEWQNPLPQGIDLFDAAFLNADNGCLFTSESVLRTTDGGANWAITPGLPLDDPTTAVTPNGTIWVAGRRVYRSTDAGASWDTVSDFPSAYPYRRVWFVDDTHGWFASFNLHTLIHTTDGGLSWSSESLEPHTGAASMEFSDTLHGWAVCSSCGTFQRTTDGGESWADVLGFHPAAISFADSLHGWIAGQHSIRRSTDGGQTFEVQYTDSNLNWTAIRCSGTQLCWAAGEGVIVRTTDGGVTWTEQTLTERCANIRSIRFANALCGWVVGDGGSIYHTTDGGDSWFAQSEGQYCALRAVSFADSLYGWAVGNRGRMMYTTNSGADWLVDLGDSTDFRTVQVTAAGAWIGGDYGHFWARSGDGDWQSRFCPTTRPITSVSFTDFFHGWAMGEGGPTYYTTDGGLTWSERHPETSMFHVRVCAVSDSEAWLLTQQCLHTTDAGLTWSQHFDAWDVEDLWFADAQHGWMLRYFSPPSERKVYTTSDGGTTWDERLALPVNSSSTVLHPGDALNAWVTTFDDVTGSWGMRTTDGGLTWDSVPIGISWAGRPSAMAVVDGEHAWIAGMGPGIRRFAPGALPVADAPHAVIPKQLRLSAYPNPFNPVTTLAMDLPSAGAVRVQLFDVTGRWVQTLCDDVFSAGSHTLEVNGATLPSGIYFARIEQVHMTRTLKLVLLK